MGGRKKIFCLSFFLRFYVRFENIVITIPCIGIIRLLYKKHKTTGNFKLARFN